MTRYFMHDTNLAGLEADMMRLFALILAVCMVFTMMPPVTGAWVTDSEKLLLTRFAFANPWTLLVAV